MIIIFADVFIRIVLDRKGPGVQWVPSEPLKVQLCSMCCTKEVGVIVHLCSSRPCVESCGEVMCPSPPKTLTPSTQATHPSYPSHYRVSTSSLAVGWTLMVHTKRVREQPNPWSVDADQCMSIIAICFPSSITFQWSNLQIFCLPH